MNLDIVITGFGADERIAFEAPVPAEAMAKARELARVPDDDPAVVLCYALSERDAAAILGEVPPGLDYFLEGVARSAAQSG